MARIIHAGTAQSLAAAALLGALLGCAVPPPDAASPRDHTTASDQSDADRRARVRLELAAGYFGRGQFETALDEVKLALNARPDMSEALSLRGLIYAALKDDRLAEDSFRRALQANPRDPDAMHNFGWFLCERRRFAEAIPMFQQAIATPQYPSLSRSHMALGICQARSGALAEAEKSLARSYELDPTNPVTAVNLSDVLYRRGDLERARFYIRRINNVAELSSAQTLWLAARIEHKLGNQPSARDLGRQLRNRFPQSPEALAFERGRYDD
jgi:type IV pilus assembly protein PilF